MQTQGSGGGSSGASGGARTQACRSPGVQLAAIHKQGILEEHDGVACALGRRAGQAVPPPAVGVGLLAGGRGVGSGHVLSSAGSQGVESAGQPSEQHAPQVRLGMMFRTAQQLALRWVSKHPARHALPSPPAEPPPARPQGSGPAALGPQQSADPPSWPESDLQLGSAGGRAGDVEAKTRRPLVGRPPCAVGCPAVGAPGKVGQAGTRAKPRAPLIRVKRPPLAALRAAQPSVKPAPWPAGRATHARLRCSRPRRRSCHPRPRFACTGRWQAACNGSGGGGKEGADPGPKSRRRRCGSRRQMARRGRAGRATQKVNRSPACKVLDLLDICSAWHRPASALSAQPGRKPCWRCPPQLDCPAHLHLSVL